MSMRLRDVSSSPHLAIMQESRLTRERIDELIAVLKESVRRTERARRAESQRRREVARTPAQAAAAPKLRLVKA